MKVISVYSPKGGVGKTTLSINIAGGYAARGKRVCVVDVDEQESAYSVYGTPEAKIDFDVLADFPKEDDGYEVIIIDHHPSHKHAPIGDFIVCPITPGRLDFESYMKAQHLFVGTRHLLVINMVDRRVHGHKAFVRGIKESFEYEKPLVVNRRQILARATEEATTIFNMKSNQAQRQCRFDIEAIIARIDHG